MPKITNFTEAQAALRPLYQNARTLYNLDVMKKLMNYLDNPQDKVRIIHIAGTSGKTSTTYYTAALLQEQGLTVGFTVSPHVDYINERLQINGQPLPEAEYCALLTEFMDLIADCDVQPSYFELLTAMSYWEFARRGVDYAVIEVGMGGEMDATNVINRTDKVCIITDIGLDHTEILGDTLGKIAWYKAGIIKHANHVVMYQQSEEVMEVVREAVTANVAVLHDYDDTIAVTTEGLPLFQQRNLGLAKQAVDYVNQRDGRPLLTEEQLTAASHITIPARLERFKIGNKTVIVDGSHNQQKLHALLQSINELYPHQDIAVLCSFVAGSETRWQGGLDELINSTKSLLFTSFHSEKDMPKTSADPARFVAYCNAKGYYNCSVELDPATAWKALQRQPEPILLVTGSFYLLNHIRPLIMDAA
ncbi:folylpolyglutamate synthase/dihydrofolate synthase family protein [soil metagenome]